jgi:tRNA (cmo5U34)-methyltransferase
VYRSRAGDARHDVQEALASAQDHLQIAPGRRANLGASFPAMSHSVERHLEVTPVAYDVQIRRFVPGYDAMFDEVVGALAEHLPGGVGRVLDLGAGTGALSARLAERFPAIALTLLDADAEMLAQARVRLASHSPRTCFLHATFADPLPACDAAVASLALHHVHDRTAKRDVYRHILGALRPGGVLVNADATVPGAKALARPVMARWARHLMHENGDSEAEAHARFASWALEDRYFGIDEELDMLREAGFGELDVRWRVGSQSVIVARRPL